jgi:hypothetical protein
VAVAPGREALLLIQPATVDRWHREGVGQCWCRRLRCPGRPRIDRACRDLIRRIAAENCLWDAPRIHGELLKLGITISERTVSRYLRGRPTTRSQTWRTFFANHFGASHLAVADDEQIVIDASDVSFGSVPSTDAASCLGPSAGWGRSLQPSSLGVSRAQHHLRNGTRVRKSGGRDPPLHLPLQPVSRRRREVHRSLRLPCDRRQCQIDLAARLDHVVLSLSRCAI